MCGWFIASGGVTHLAPPALSRLKLPLPFPVLRNWFTASHLRTTDG